MAQTPKSEPLTPKRNLRLPKDTHYVTEIGGTRVEIVAIKLFPDKPRGMLGELRVCFGPLDMTYRIVRADGEPFIAAPSHTVRARDGRTKYLHRSQIRDEAEAARFNEFLMAAYRAAVAEWGHPPETADRRKPHRVHVLLDRVAHIPDPQGAWEALLEGLTRVLCDSTATTRETASACRTLSALMSREFKRRTQAIEALTAIGDAPSSELLRRVIASELGLLNDSAPAQ